MDPEVEQIREVDWLRRSVADQVCMPKAGFDTFLLHPDHAAALGVEFWQGIVRNITSRGGGVGFLHDDIPDAYYPELHVFVFSPGISADEAAGHIFEAGWDLLDEGRIIPFAEVTTAEGHFKISLFTGGLEPFE